MAEKKLNIDFMGKRKVAAVFSAVLIVLSITSLVTRSLSFGLDFTGGSLVEVAYSEAPKIEEVRSTLAGAGFKNAKVQNFGSDTDIVVRLMSDPNMTLEESNSLGEVIINALRNSTDAEVSMRRNELVGPQVGEELRDQGGLGMLIALIMVMVYVAIRFQFKFSVGAVAALAHDVIITLGLFSIFQWDFDLTVLAAVLAVIGYSLNDTIVVSDRIRENFRKLRKGTPIEIVNRSLNETLGRTLVTSLTTLLVLMALFIWGGELIHQFATALIVGVVVGTYSSIYVAANVLLAMDITKEDLMIIAKEGAELDDMP